MKGLVFLYQGQSESGICLGCSESAANRPLSGVPGVQIVPVAIVSHKQ
jgi:hypothetical protein